MTSPNICFIGGSGRSGTIALKKAFMHHPECTKIQVEMRLFVDPDGIVDFYSTFSDTWEPFLYDVKVRRLRRLLQQIGAHSFAKNVYRYFVGKTGLNKIVPFVMVPRYAELGLSKYCPHYFELVDALMEELADFQYKARWVGSDFLQNSTMTYKSPPLPIEMNRILRKFMMGFIKGVLEYQGAKHFFDSTPRTILWFDKLHQLLPESKLVHVYRDPRDVAASFTKVSFAPSDPLKSAKIVKDVMDQWLVVKNTLPAGSVKEVALETLVSEPQHVLRDVCAFLNINWDPNMLRTDLGHAHTGRWKRDFTKKQQKEVNNILAPLLERLSYAK